MAPSNPTSRNKYEAYKRDLKDRFKRGDSRSAQEIQKQEEFAAGAPQNESPGQYSRWSGKRDRSFFQLFRAFIQMLRGHRTYLVLSLITGTISTLIGLLPLYGTKLVIDNVLDGKPLEDNLAWLPLPEDRRMLLRVIALAMIGLALLSVGFSLWGRWHATRITKRIQISVRRTVFDHAVHLPLHRVYDLKSGGAASLLRDDAGGVANLVFGMLYNPWRAIVQLSGSLLILTWTDWRLLLGSLILIPTVYMTHKTWIGRIRPIFKDIRATRQMTDAHATETFGGMRVVRSFARERAESAKYTRNNDLLVRQEVLSWWWSRAVDLAWAMFVPAASAALLWYGGNRILDDIAAINAGTLDPKDALTVGDLVMFLAYLGWLLGPLEMLASSATQFQNSLAGLDRVLNLLDEPQEMQGHQGSIKVSRDAPPCDIVLKNLTYTYPRAPHPVLTNVNLTVPAGQMVALVGPSGAGKSTLCNLIARFYDPTGGSITYGGTDLKDIDVQSYRSLLGIVEQDTFLFDGSIAENIAYGRRDSTEAQIHDAARKANAFDFVIALPKGFDTHIGERGVRLSGGQRQRLTIARAILADPRILILDEATSSLDTESERLIQASLKTLMQGRTSFVIAHRLSTIAHADHIIVVEGGTIAEEGHHEELMQKSGRYQQMVTLQTQPPPPELDKDNDES